MHDESFGCILLRTCEQGLETLLVLHTDGHWGFPKGHRNEGENPITAALRETWEEVGIDEISINPRVTFIEEYVYKEGDQEVHKKVTYYPGEVLKGQMMQVDGIEIVDCKWVPLASAKECFTFDSKKALIDEVFIWAHEDRGLLKP